MGEISESSSSTDQEHLDTDLTVYKTLPNRVLTAINTLVRYCVFHTGDTTQKEFWSILKQHIAPGVLTGIVRIQRINQPNGNKRMDIWVKKTNSVRLKQALGLDSVQRRTGLRTNINNPTVLSKPKAEVPKVMRRWRIDVYKAHRDRPLRVERPMGPTMRSYPRGIATLNMNGLQKRMLELQLFLRYNDIAALAAQETLLQEGSYFPDFDHYAVFNRPATEGFRGQAILVHKSYNAYEVTKNRLAFATHIRVAGLVQDSKPWHIISFYLPSGGNKRSQRTEAMKKIIGLSLKIQSEDRDAHIILLGDGNMKRTEMTKKLKSNRTGLHLMEVTGSPLTFHRKGTRMSDIDHIVANGNTLKYLTKAKVKRH
ncbi:hypothetical protein BT96DRAFT_844447, partial [Gymnopus androsaceus JB14]